MGFTRSKEFIFIYAISESHDDLKEWSRKFDKKVEKKGIEYTGPFEYGKEKAYYGDKKSKCKKFYKLHFKLPISDRTENLLQIDPVENIYFEMTPESRPDLSIKDVISEEEIANDGEVTEGMSSDTGDSRSKSSSSRKHSSKSNPELDNLREQAEEAAVEEVPESATVTQQTKQEYTRSSEVRDYVMARADGECEGCGEPAPFTSKTGEPYLHAHHLHELSDGGSDTPETVVALCPNCHYRVHHGQDGEEYNQELLQIVEEIENQ